MIDPATDHELDAARARAVPAVLQSGGRWTLLLGAAVVLLLGGLTFAALYRPQTPQSSTAIPLPVASAMRAPSTTADLPPAPTLVAAEPPAVAIPVAQPAPAVVQMAMPNAQPAPEAPTERRPSSPALIIDLTAGEKPATPIDPNAAKMAGGDKLSSNESFAERLNRTAPETVGTEKLSSTDRVIPQGTVITAVLETAINSDLPGMVRAVVSRDVMGFDGTRVLVPRGSRLIGQYSSGVALGQSRAFVIWSRMLRSDGVSVQLGSAATDQLGSAGLGGKVDNHFLRRFGAATLLSVISGVIDRYANSGGGSQILVGSSTQANQLASIALQRQIDIPPTIKIAQGTPVRVFVARDLDFAETRGKRP
jgi:type IV secretory pathway VirB10-like protein